MDWLDAFDNYLKTAEHAAMKPPAFLNDILTIEKSLTVQDRVSGFQFPPSYKAFLLRYNGGYLSDRWSAQDGGKGGSICVRFGSLKTVAEDNDADSVFMDHEIDTYFGFEPLVMFAGNGGGDMWAFDPRQTRKDNEMPVVVCDHESGKVYAQSTDFMGFLSETASHKLPNVSRDKGKLVSSGPSW